MKPQSLHKSGHHDCVVCPHATGLSKRVRCRLINHLPIDTVFKLCGNTFVECDEYRRLNRQEKAAAHRKRHVSKLNQHVSKS